MVRSFHLRNCPLYVLRTAQPVTGDLFAITVDNTNSDQGLWQDACKATASGFVSTTVTFVNQIADAAIDTGGGTNIPQGATIYRWPPCLPSRIRCSWGRRDIFAAVSQTAAPGATRPMSTTAPPRRLRLHSTPSMRPSAPRAWMYFGNDGGLWRTTDDVSQQQPTCSSDDAAHFQNLNNGIGSLAEIGSFSQHPQNQNVLAMGASAPLLRVGSSTWAQILGGEGDVNAIDPANPQNWYATSAAPVDIDLCTQDQLVRCRLRLSVIGGAQVGNDSYGLTGIAPWILDPQNTANLIVGTCRVWRGPAANGAAWSGSNALSPMLDTVQNPYCDGTCSSGRLLPREARLTLQEQARRYTQAWQEASMAVRP